jgi:hypothetical protein
MTKTLKVYVATLAALGGMAGMGAKTAHALDVFCPFSHTAAWIQAANGRTNTVNRISSRLGGAIGRPSSTLTCIIDDVPDGETIRQVVQLEPNSVPSACGAKATFSGLGTTRNGVPPFGGFIFKGQRLPATPTYTQSTGVCQLDIPLEPVITSVKVSQVCTPLNLNSWRCPDSTFPVN